MRLGGERDITGGVARRLGRRSAAVAVLACTLGWISACRDDVVRAEAPPADAGLDEDTGSAPVPDAGRLLGCPGETPASYPWRPPVAAQSSACTGEDLERLRSAIAAKSLVAADDIATALGPTCAACAIGSVEDPTWRAVVSGHEGYIGNVGGCTMLVGADEPCGRAIDELSTCLIVGCAGCEDRRAEDSCADTLTTVDGACARALTDARERCPARSLASAFDSQGSCQSFVETIRLFCGPARDGG
ncbi:MAG: hypothetical protein KIS78_15045 [Labilithrix sp.]|nr:hypothetical protein [Labilithrix sp.]